MKALWVQFLVAALLQLGQMYIESVCVRERKNVCFCRCGLCVRRLNPKCLHKVDRSFLFILDIL